MWTIPLPRYYQFTANERGSAPQKHSKGEEMATANRGKFRAQKEMNTEGEKEMKGRLVHTTGNSNTNGGIEMTNEITLNKAIFSVKQVLGTLALGAMLLTAVFLPSGTISADEPARPLIPNYYLYDMDLLDPGIYDAKVVRSGNAARGFDMDLLDPGFYDAKVVRAGNAARGFDMDLLDPGIYDAKVVRAGNAARGFDMDLLDPGIYEAKVVRSGNSAQGFDMDLLDPGIYDAKAVRSGNSAHTGIGPSVVDAYELILGVDPNETSS